MTNLLQTIREVIKKAGGIDKVAALCGYKNANILRNQLTETNRQHKLGAEELSRIIDVCKPYSIEIAQIFAVNTETVLIQLPKAQKQKVKMMELILQAGKAFGNVSAVFLESLDPKSEDGVAISDNEFRRIECQIIHGNRAYQEILAYAQQRREEHNG